MKAVSTLRPVAQLFLVACRDFFLFIWIVFHIFVSSSTLYYWTCMVSKRAHVFHIEICGCNFSSKEVRVNFTPWNFLWNSSLKVLLDFLLCHVFKIFWIWNKAERRLQGLLVITHNGVFTSASYRSCNTGILVVFICKKFSLKFTNWNESSLRPDALYWVVRYSIDYHGSPLWHL